MKLLIDYKNVKPMKKHSIFKKNIIFEGPFTILEGQLLRWRSSMHAKAPLQTS